RDPATPPELAGSAVTGILYLDPSEGELQAAPVVFRDTPSAADADDAKAGGRGWLALSLAKAGKTRLVAYSLPLEGPDQKPVGQALELPARHQFAPWYDKG